VRAQGADGAGRRPDGDRSASLFSPSASASAQTLDDERGDQWWLLCPPRCTASAPSHPPSRDPPPQVRTHASARPRADDEAAGD
jgi:hypothetical protein